MFGRRVVPWKNRRKESERQAEIEVWTEPGGGHPERDDGGRTGAAGARSSEVAFHGRPRQPRHDTSVR